MFGKELAERGVPSRRGERQPESESRRYYDPVLLFFTGLPFSGKTALGVAIESATNIRYFDVDETRSDLWGQMDGPLPGMGEWYVMVSSYDIYSLHGFTVTIWERAIWRRMVSVYSKQISV